MAIEYLSFFSYQGKPLSRETREAVRDIAYWMREHNQKKKSFKSENLELRIWTNFDTAVIGSISGLRFWATIETDDGRIEIDFMIREDLSRDDVRTQSAASLWLDLSQSHAASHN